MQESPYEHLSMLDRGRLQAQVMLLKAVANESRFQILETLLQRERNVSQIVAAVGLPQATVSHHLACLRNCGLVQTRKEGKEVFYVLNGEGRIRKLMELVRQQVEETLEGVLSCDVLDDESPRTVKVKP